MTARLLALALVLALPGPALAYAWRADAQAFALDGGLLLVAISAGVAFFHIRVRGQRAALVWVALAGAAAAFPAARVPLAVLTCIFLVYGFCRVT